MPVVVYKGLVALLIAFTSLVFSFSININTNDFNKIQDEKHKKEIEEIQKEITEIINGCEKHIKEKYIYEWLDRERDYIEYKKDQGEKLTKNDLDKMIEEGMKDYFEKHFDKEVSNLTYRYIKNEMTKDKYGKYLIDHGYDKKTITNFYFYYEIGRSNKIDKWERVPIEQKEPNNDRSHNAKWRKIFTR